MSGRGVGRVIGARQPRIMPVNLRTLRMWMRMRIPDMPMGMAAGAHISVAADRQVIGIIQFLETEKPGQTGRRAGRVLALCLTWRQ
jgi:hypothetical protein